MNATSLAARALVCTGATFLCLTALPFGHGGTYRGPGDTVPPGGGTGGGGSGPATPGNPGSPGMPGTPTPGPGGPVTPGGSPGNPSRPGMTSDGGGPDLTAWTFWWEFNKEPYLDLKAAIHEAGPRTGSDEWFLTPDRQGAKDTLRPSEEDVRGKVVPALLKALATETNNDIVTGCMVALAKIGDEKDESGTSQFEEAIKPHLASKVQEIAETAAVALGILANDHSVATLSALLRDDAAGRAQVGGGEVTYRTRAFAAYGLSLIGARTAQESTRSTIVQNLISVLESDSSSTRDVKVACLISLGLVPLEKVRDEAPVEEGQTAVPHTSRVGQLEYLLRFFADDEEHHYLVRAHVPAALGRLLKGLSPEEHGVYKQRVAELLLAGGDKRSKEPAEVIQSCVLALGQIGDNDADQLDESIRELLIASAEDQGDQQARNFSLIALAQAGGRLGSGEPAGKDAVAQHLVDTLEQGDSSLRPWAGLAIGVYGRSLVEGGLAMPADVAESLRAALLEEKSNARIGAYAIGAGIMKDIEARDDLIKKLAIKDDETRGYVAVALGLMDATPATNPIRMLVTESKHRPELLRQAAIGLGLLGDKRVVEDLIAMLGEAQALSTQAALAAALGSIGDARSVEPLVALLANQGITESARGFAAVALGIVADKEARPWNSKISVDLNYRASTSTLTDQAGLGILNIL